VKSFCSNLHDRALAFLPMTLVVIVLVTCNVLTTMAQSETPAKPAATETTPIQKSGTKEPAAPPITGAIRGRLTATDGQPLMNANVLVQSLTGTPVAKPSRPDAEGRFVFEDLSPGAYIVMATAPGYIDQSMALGNPLQWPRHLIGSNVNISMIRGGVITGLVTNPKGEPMVGVPVHATVTNTQSSSMLGFVSGGGISETDDRGIYRIYGLLPGQYTVNAGGKGAFGQFNANGFDIDVPTYYPSNTRDTGVPVSVRSGDETTGIDIKYRGAGGHSISGVVLGNIEASPAGGAVTIMLAHAATASVLSLEIAGVADPRRAFSFNGVADGEYDLFASYLTNPNDNALIGTKRVTVRGGDLSGIELRLIPLGSMAGTITLDPIKPEDKCDKRGSQIIETILKLPPDDPKKAANQPLTAMFSGLGQLNDKGEFALRNLEAAKYRFDIKLPTESWYIRAINLPASAVQAIAPTTAAQSSTVGANTAAWQGLVTIKPGDQLSGISIMVGQDAATLRGRVGPEGTAIREGTHVHLVPVETNHANNVLRYSDTLVRRDGSFAFTNLAPGRYFILSRVEAPTEPDTSPRPIAWDPTARANLRRETEAAKTEVELKPCQSMADYQLK
jgi:carboxypeptidase family protein